VNHRCYSNESNQKGNFPDGIDRNGVMPVVVQANRFVQQAQTQQLHGESPIKEKQDIQAKYKGNWRQIPFQWRTIKKGTVVPFYFLYFSGLYLFDSPFFSPAWDFNFLNFFVSAIGASVLPVHYTVLILRSFLTDHFPIFFQSPEITTFAYK